MKTDLTTEESKGRLLQGKGERWTSSSGKARLVGVAEVPKTNDFLLNTFLQLPTNALAELSGLI